MIEPASLGATLYVPADRPDLLQIALGGKYPELRSVIFCLEDAVSESRIPVALANLQALFDGLKASGSKSRDRPTLFARPRHAAMLGEIAGMSGVEELEGFVLPKVTAETLDDYVKVLPSDRHCIMPTIETREAFDPEAMTALRSKLLLIRDRVLVIRIGGNDLLRTIGARRSRLRTIYQGPVGAVIANLVTTFVPYGFSMSSAVCDCFDDPDLLREEVELDLDHGLWTKSAIHPRQVSLIHDLYRVSVEDLSTARAIIDVKAPAVFSMNGSLIEPATHAAWAKNILLRSESFGILSAPQMAMISA